MVRALVILDGAAEPLWPWPSTLDAARTPALDRLCARGTVARLRTTPPGLQAGSETGIPTVLGVAPAAPVSRGLVEAAAAGIVLEDGTSAWRVDLHHRDGRRTQACEARLLQPLLRTFLPNHCVTYLRGHRMLAIGAHRPAISSVAALDARVWGDGGGLPRALDGDTVVVCGPGAAAGCGRLLGATVVVPEGATGDVDTDLVAKAVAAVAQLRDGATVVVHVGAPDEAAHRRDRHAKCAAIEAADAQLVGPLAEAVAARGGVMAVSSDHGTCPDTGRHDGAPVPVVVAGPGVPIGGPARLSERAAAACPVLRSPWERHVEVAAA